MARNIAFLLPLLLLACDGGSPASADTDDESSSDSTDSDGTEGTSGGVATSNNPATTMEPGDTTSDASTSGGADTSGGPDDTTSTTGDDTTSTGPDDTSSSSGDPPMPVCGDGRIEGDETCDDGASNGDYGQCAADCSGPGPYCGDGMTDAAYEQCDDGDAVDGNGCNVDCIVSGSTLWEVTKTTLGSASIDLGLDVAALDDGTIRMGQRSEPTSTTQQLILTDYDLDGNELDEQLYVNSASNTLNIGVRSMDASGGYLVTWIATGVSTNPDDVVARDVDHLIDWSVDLVDAADIERRPGGGAIYIDRDNGLAPTQWFVLESAGAQSYSSPTDAAVYHGNLMPAGDDAVIFAGAVDVGGFQPTLSRYDLDGTLVYREFYALPPGGDLSAWTLSSMAVHADGRVALANNHSGAANNEVLVSVFDSDGQLLWDEFYAHPGDDDVTSVNDVAIDAHGNVFVVGAVRTGPFGSWDTDALVLKYDASGTLLWSRTFAGAVVQGGDNARGVSVLEDDSVVVVGSREDIENAPDAWLIRLAP